MHNSFFPKNVIREIDYLIDTIVHLNPSSRFLNEWIWILNSNEIWSDLKDSNLKVINQTSQQTISKRIFKVKMSYSVLSVE